MAKHKDAKGAKMNVPASSSNNQDGPMDDVLAEGKSMSMESPCVEAVPPVTIQGTGPAEAVVVTGPDGAFKVQLQRAGSFASDDEAFWVAIRDRTNAISFDNFEQFVHTCLSKELPHGLEATLGTSSGDDLLHFGVDAYKRLKTATEAFLILNCGLAPTLSENFKEIAEAEESARLGRVVTADTIQTKLGTYLGEKSQILPYIRHLLSPGEVTARRESRFRDTLVTGDPMRPCMLELIWSYWHEEGMLVQAINAIALRFQNKRTAAGREILGELEMSPLRPLSNLMWGYIQDEPFRLTVVRRTYEYLHEYGLPLQGRAVSNLQPAESRSRFLEAFHSLLHQVAQFYERDADTTVIADAFPVLNALKEVHLLLAEGAHNQFRDLPWTARVEMLIQQWLLSRREMREFLRGRQMVPYKERWMGQVDSVKRFYGMTETPVTHFRDLGVFGEQILLSIRYADWNNVVDPDRAKNWLRYWRPEIQGYIHAYRAATGIDLSATAQRIQPVNATAPTFLLQQRLAQQQRPR